MLPILRVVAVCSTLAGLSLEDCIGFLLDRSPRSDLTPQGVALLEANAEIALWTRESTPWGPLIPDSVFLRYVLPARVSQEPLVEWRSMLRDSVLPAVEGLSSIEQAALAVGAWCDERTAYEPTQKRDQSPLVTWRSGIGRCEELTIFYMDALRSVGIPCRQAYTPWWSCCDNNHAWTEVWTPDGWKYAESSSAADSLSSAWFDENVSKASLVLAIAPDSVPGTLRTLGGASFVNVTANYTRTGTLTVGDDTTEVFVSIVNWGSFRTLVRLDEDLRSVELGAGVYMVSWGWPLRTGFVMLLPGDSLVYYPEETGHIEGVHLVNVPEVVQ
ncbi:transglutaminase domain-containing protein [Candidatus Fermentibacterales bacterium]|nr:transglutaminase domain-containing protein [Candidatus Fermentibacterales bacterium]